MDVWRYSDWWGLGDQLRNSQKHIWHWRDWIVESLNKDTPYDEMIRLMLAADELHPNDLERLRATGYLARNYWLFNRPQWMEETVEHVSKGFLGLTLNCSRCHDHKYDPIQQADYYRFRAFFEPYHVRMDVVPGEADLAKNGIPRAFDGLPDEPTFLYVRGDERNPDKSQVIAPGIPSLLAFDELRIEPVELPVDAWQPERRVWVRDAYVAAAKSGVSSAEAALRQADDKVKSAVSTLEQLSENKPTITVGSPAALISESFSTLDPSRWTLFGGNWVHEPGQLFQKLDGATRSAVRLKESIPSDFDASIRFTILGGSQWRSVGIAFDASQDDPSQTPKPDDTEQTVYVSAVAGGSKVQAAYHRGGEWQFPQGSGVRNLPIELNREYTLRVQVRDTLINAQLNGVPVVAWNTALPRRSGAFQVITFDALTAIHEITVGNLDPGIQLLSPEALLNNTPVTLEMAQAAVAEARAEQQVAAEALSVARAALESVERRADAQLAEWESSAENAREKIHLAIRSERQIEVARSRHKIAAAELARLRAPADQKEAAEKSVNEAHEALRNAIATVDAEIKPTDTYTRFIGAAWTPTRFFNSLKDDRK